MKPVPRHAVLSMPARLPSKPDGVTVLTVYLAMLLGIPSNLGFGPLGGAGSPASLFGMGMLVWWVWDRVHRPRADIGAQPVRIAMLAFCGCVLVSYIEASLSPLPQLDMNGADRSLLRVASFAGVLLVANDGIPNVSRFVVMLRRLVLIATLYACLGLAQFFTRRTLVGAFQIPGLTTGDDYELGTRVDFARAQATATHALEYSSVLAIAVPVAISLAMYDTQRQHRHLRWVSVAVLCLAAVLSVSRSSLVGLALGILVLMPSWRPATRRRAVALGVAGCVAIYVLIPGMVGTIRGMFAGASEDSSIASRTAGFAIVERLFALHPVVGRGLGTFLPSYRILDNQYLDLLVEVGILGLSAYLGLLVCAVATARWRGASDSDSLMSALRSSLCAAVLAGGVLMAFFDSFSFQQASGLLVMMAGFCGAYARLKGRLPTRAPGHRPADPGSNRTTMWQSLVRRWYVALGVAVAVAVPSLVMAQRVQGVYYSDFRVTVLMPPGATSGNPLWTGSDAMVPYAALIQRQVAAHQASSTIETVSAPLYGTGIRDGERIYLPNSGGQWRATFRDPEILVEVVGTTAASVEERSRRAIAEIEQAADLPQSDMGVPPRARITTSVSPPIPSVVYIPVRTGRADLSIVALAVALSVAAALVAAGSSNRARGKGEGCQQSAGSAEGREVMVAACHPGEGCPP